jgi:hypothetical protein
VGLWLGAGVGDPTLLGSPNLESYKSHVWPAGMRALPRLDTPLLCRYPDSRAAADLSVPYHQGAATGLAR